MPAERHVATLPQSSLPDDPTTLPPTTLPPTALPPAALPDDIVDLLEPWAEARRVIITTSALCASQLNRFVREHDPELAASLGVDAPVGMNQTEPRAGVDLITPVDMAEWVLAMSLCVEPLFAASDLEFAVVVNDFTLRPAQRRILKREWPAYFPENLLAVAQHCGARVVTHSDHLILECQSGRARRLRCKFESTLRNAAADGLERMIRKGQAGKDGDGTTTYTPIAGRVHVRSNATYRYQPQARVELTRTAKVPLCSAIMMYHFKRQPADIELFINVAGLDMTCGYRNGAEAYLNLINPQSAFVNLFFDEAGDEDAYYDVYQPD